MNSPARWTTLGRCTCVVTLALGMTVPALAADKTWPQWGGPTRDFKVADADLADRWPAEGPKRLWQRPLGEGYSAIVTDGDRLFTMYRDGDDEIIVALDAGTGKTIWEHRCPAAPSEDQTADFGQGPNAAPLLMGDRLIAVGFTGSMHCLDAKSGEVHWSHDLVGEFHGAVQYYGYANSPLAYKGTIIVPVGGADFAVAALNPSDGSLLWKSRPGDISYAAPVLIDVDGQKQFVYFSPNEVIGLEPSSGAFLWSHPVANLCRTNCTAAIWGDDNLLWAATKGVGGTRVLRLKQSAGKTNVEEVWLNRKVRVYHWNALRVGDYVYTSTGDSTSVLAGVDIKTGEIVHRQRGFASTNGIYADGKMILLDHDGKLALATVADGKFDIVSSVQLFNSTTWTPPTLADGRLYVRDRSSMVALDLR